MQTDHWKGGALAREALLNVLSVRSRALPLCVVALALGTMLPLLAAAEERALSDQLATLSLTGRNVVVFESGRPQEASAIDRTSCENLAEVTGVQRAGLLRALPRQDVLPLGRSTLVMAASTQLFPALSSVDVVVGSALWTQRGEFRIMLSDEVLTARVNEPQPVGIDTNSAVVVGLSNDNQTGPTCIAVLDPLVDSQAFMTDLSSQLSSEGSPIVAREVRPQAVDPIAAFLVRPSKWLPLLLGILGGAATAMLFRLRSSEIAAYRLSGTSRRSMLVILGCEAVLIATPEAVAGTATSLLLRNSFHDPFAAVLAVGASGALWVLVALGLAVFAVQENPLSLAKDR